MYREIYDNIFQVVDRIRSGEYESKLTTETKKETGLFSKPMPTEEPKKKEEDWLTFSAEMILALRAQAEEAKVPPATSRRPVSRGQNASEIGLRLMGDLQKDFGLSLEQAAGVVGNLHYESGGFKYMQEISPIVKGSKGGYGYAQWTGPRRVEFESWAESQGLDIDSYEANYGNLKRELTTTSEGSVLVPLSKATNSTQATEVFTNRFLRPGKPNMNARIGLASSYLEAANHV